jgi:hypothetical protein
METVAINFDLDSNNYAAGLGFLVVYQNQVLVDIDKVASKNSIKFDLDVEDGDHALQFTMKNKTIDNTVIDEHGNIVSDSYLTIANMHLENVDLGYTFIENSVYHHDFNGSKDKIEETFYGTMGCNGTVTFRFTTPFYIWLLENI